MKPNSATSIKPFVDSAFARVLRRGIVFDKKISFEEWEKLGARIRALDDSLHWLIGDWINFGFGTFPARLKQVEFLTGYAGSTLDVSRRVCLAFPHSLRREEISFSLYKELLGENSEKYAYWIEMILKHDLTVYELRYALEHGEILKHAEIQLLIRPKDRTYSAEKFRLDFNQWHRKTVEEMPLEKRSLDWWEAREEDFRPMVKFYVEQIAVHVPKAKELKAA